VIESDRHWESKILREAWISEKNVASSPPFFGSFSVKSVRSPGRSFFSADGDYPDGNGNCQDPDRYFVPARPAAEPPCEPRVFRD